MLTGPVGLRLIHGWLPTARDRPLVVALVRTRAAWRRAAVRTSSAHLPRLMGLPIGTGPLGFGCVTLGCRPRSPVPGGLGRGVGLRGLPLPWFCLFLIVKRVVLDRDDVVCIDPNADIAGSWASEYESFIVKIPTFLQKEITRTCAVARM